jgi:hypothetical protein
MQPVLTVKEYTDALEQKKLMGLKCQDCNAITAPPRMTCSQCSGFRLKPVELSGKGTIVTFTVIHVPPTSRRGQPPYYVIMVELEEGPWIMANLCGVGVDKASVDLIGKKVTMTAPLPSPERRVEGGLAPLFQICD